MMKTLNKKSLNALFEMASSEKPPDLFQNHSGSEINQKTLKILIGVLISTLLSFLFFKINLPVSGIARAIPGKSIFLEAPAEGTVQQINYTSGDSVTKGDVIGLLKSEALVEELQNSNINLHIIEKKQLQSEERLKHLTNMVERNEDLYQEDVISLVELEKSKLEYNDELQNYRILRDELSAMKSHMIFLENTIKNMLIIAPISGIIMDNLEEKIGTVLHKGDLFCEIANMDKFLLELPLDERLLSNIRMGNSVSIHFSAYPRQRFTGRVIKIKHVAWEKTIKILNKENVINVIIEPDCLPFQPKAGMTAKVKIHCGKISLRWLQASSQN